MAGKYTWNPLLALALFGTGGCAWNLSGSNPVASWGPSLGSSAPVDDELPAAQAVQACLAVGHNLEKANNDAGAIGQYEKVISLDPDNKKAARRLAVLYDKVCAYSKADAEYLKLAKARPRDADLFNDWGYSYYQRTRWTEAEKHLRKAVELNSRHARARSNLGLALGQQGRYEEALQQFRAVVNEAEAHCNLAFVYWSQGKTDEARRECETANRIDPSCGKSVDMLAALDQVGKPRENAEKLAANTSRRSGDRKRPNREQLEAEARLMVSSMGAPGQSQAAPSAPPDAVTPAVAESPPVYRSPNGTAWVPVTPKKTAEPTPAADGVNGTIKWE